MCILQSLGQLIPGAYQGGRYIKKGSFAVLLFHCTININPKHIHDDTLT
jgi:hypothetical protein